MKAGRFLLVLLCTLCLLSGCTQTGQTAQAIDPEQSGSAGGRVAAWLGSYGTAAFGGEELPRPGAVVMQYTGHSDYTAHDPPTFACAGERDSIANWRTMQRRLEAMQRLGIPTEFHHYPGLAHGFGLGTGTVAEGWIDEAIAFWEAQMEADASM